MPEDHNTYTLSEDGEIGTVKIADEVVAVIAGLAATEVKGVASIGGGITNDMVARKGIKALSKGMRVEVLEEGVHVDLVVNLEYGYDITETASEIQEKVQSAIENMTGLKIDEINVHIQGVNTTSDNKEKGENEKEESEEQKSSEVEN